MAFAYPFLNIPQYIIVSTLLSRFKVGTSKGRGIQPSAAGLNMQGLQDLRHMLTDR
jgi:hypothetical protein